MFKVLTFMVKWVFMLVGLVLSVAFVAAMLHWFTFSGETVERYENVTRVTSSSTVTALTYHPGGHGPDVVVTTVPTAKIVVARDVGSGDSQWAELTYGITRAGMRAAAPKKIVLHLTKDFPLDDK